jgi:hypothetical protein
MKIAIVGSVKFGKRFDAHKAGVREPKHHTVEGIEYWY